jgi:hypothetical protein
MTMLYLFMILNSHQMSFLYRFRSIFQIPENVKMIAQTKGSAIKDTAIVSVAFMDMIAAKYII